MGANSIDLISKPLLILLSQGAARGWPILAPGKPVAKTSELGARIGQTLLISLSLHISETGDKSYILYGTDFVSY
jgi:hypothetical protein